ncbi:FIGfam138462: Acyl-CoA synthetase, AMP-(fatty) acid ligase [hydrothermal vent metagenome]|uniref:FIGfam138462: Acyl-CoA synthetase, AMP-(Fatty) acid ligase n=1 Tax=hydrothermal vent metagenome TaxID=652676 RepID=A0A3B0Z9P2_9ZZZZ
MFESDDMTEELGLFSKYRPDEPFAWCDAGSVTQQEFLLSVMALAECLPEQPYIINLCRDRYHFSLAFCAALVNGSTSLLPPNRQPQTIVEMASEYQVANCLIDDSLDVGGLNCIDVRDKQEGVKATTALAMPVIPGDQIAVIAFTSGSTGKPAANQKHWRTLVGTSTLLAQRFFCNVEQRLNIVATVPAQHMYGLEMSVMVALHGGGVMASSHPFFPQEVANSLAQVPEPRCLVTTPVHLRAMIKSGIEMPPVVTMISATAPLTNDISRQAEQAFDCEVEEIYGCTEAGSLATRRTSAEESWRMLDGIVLSEERGQAFVSAPHLPDITRLQDRLEPLDRHSFRFIGRGSDLVNIAGKRISLADVTHKLLSINGVEDAVVFMPEESGKHIQRLAALIVSELSNQEISRELVRFLDPVFIPRPLKRVKKLPRNEVGKILMSSAQEIIKIT